MGLVGLSFSVNPNGLQFPLLKFGVPPGAAADVGASLRGQSGAYWWGSSALGTSDAGWKWKNILVFAAIFWDSPFLAT